MHSRLNKLYDSTIYLYSVLTLRILRSEASDDCRFSANRGWWRWTSRWWSRRRRRDRFSWRARDAEREASAWGTTFDARQVFWKDSVHRHSSTRSRTRPSTSLLSTSATNPRPPRPPPHEPQPPTKLPPATERTFCYRSNTPLWPVALCVPGQGRLESRRRGREACSKRASWRCWWCLWTPRVSYVEARRAAHLAGRVE